MLFFAISFHTSFASDSPSLTKASLVNQYTFSPDTTVLYDSVYVYDTVLVYQAVYDTVLVYDTVFVYEVEKIQPENASSVESEDLSPSEFEFRGNDDQEYYRKLHNLSAEVYVSVFQHEPVFVNTPLSLKTLEDQRIQSTSGQVGNSLGLNLNFHASQRFYLQTGLSISQFRNQINLEYDKVSIDTNFIQEINNVTLWHMDTVWFLDYDALMQGDTVFVPVMDSGWVQSTDTTITNEIIRDTSLYKAGSSSHWTYIELPLIAAWSWQQNYWSAEVKSGLIAGVLTQNQRYNVFSDEGGFIVKQYGNKGEMLLHWDFYMSALIQYQFSENWGVLMEPYARFSLNPAQNEGLTWRQNKKGIRLGIRYNF